MCKKYTQTALHELFFFVARYSVPSGVTAIYSLLHTLQKNEFSAKICLLHCYIATHYINILIIIMLYMWFCSKCSKHFAIFGLFFAFF